MSKEVDERVVSMQFDNRHFEKNVQTTMSTLDKLKQKLHLPGAAKGLEEVSAASKKLDFSPMSKGLETVKVKFSAMQIAGITAMTNLTNSAINAGKRITSALTIDPVKTGFNEYELKMDSVKTIMASTGEDIERVNELLEELNEYSDQTIYSFSDMTQNIGKFTNAGVKLDDAVLAIKGISNEAALSGANANEASRAMYNFAQALSVGYIQRIDWKSIELANMATQEFKEQLLNSAIAAGTVKKSADGMYATLAHPDKAYNAAAMFTETLDDQWLTTEVLINTLKDYSDATTDIGKRAFAAAQDVTKLSQMFDVLKETAQSGWAKTWEIIFGDLNQAKAIFTPLTEFFGNIIEGIDDFRNAILEGALGKTFKTLLEPIQGIKKTVETVTEPIDKITKSLEEYNAVVKEVIRGDWGVTQKRWDALAEAGYDWATVQNMVNEELGSSVRHATNFSIGQAETAKSTEKLTETNNEYIASLTKMSDAELRSLNLTDEQIEAIKQLKKEADKLGLSVEDFLANIDNLDGRWVVIQTFKNIGEALGKVFKTVAQAWKEIFPPKSIEERSNALYNIIAALHKFSLKLQMSEGTADNLKRTLKGVFAIIDIITTITGGAFKVAIKVLCKVLGALDIDILSVTASVGDAIVAFRDWLLNGNLVAKCLKKIIEVGGVVGSVIKKWIGALLDIPIVQNGVKKLTSFLVEAFNVGKDTIKGLVNGLKDGTISIVDIVSNIGKKIIDTIKKILDIHSPSRVMFEIGKFIVEGLVNGIKAVISTVGDVAGHIVSTLMDVLGKIDTGKIAALGALASGFGMIYGAIKLVLGVAKMTNKLGDIFESVSDVVQASSKVVENFAGTLKAFSLNLKAKALKEIAIAIAILAGSVVVLSLLDPMKLLGAVTAIAALAGVLVALMWAMDKFGGDKDPKESLNFASLALALVGMGIAVALIAAAIKKIGNLDEDAATRGIACVSVIMLELGALLVAFSTFTNGRQAKNIDKAGKLFTKLAVAMLLLTLVAKILSKMTWKDLGKAAAGIGFMTVIVVALVAISNLAGNKISSVGKTISKIAIAMLLLTLLAKSIAKMSWEDMAKAGVGITFLAGIITGLIAATKLAGNDIDAIGGTILKISVAMTLLALVAKSIAKMSWEELGKAGIGLGFLTGIIALLVLITKMVKEPKEIATTLLGISGAITILAVTAKIIATMKWSEMAKAGVGLLGLVGIVALLVKITEMVQNPAKVGLTLLALSAAIGILAGVAILIGFIDVKQLAKGLIAVTLLGGIVAAMLKCTEKARNNWKSLFAMAAAIAVMAIAVAGLSFIKPSKLAGATAALSVLMGMFSLMILATSKSKDCMKDLIVMTAVIAVISIILGNLSKLPAKQTIAAATALSEVLLAISAAIAILSVTKSISANALVAVGVMTAITLAFGGLLYLLKDLPVETTMANAKALSEMLIALSAACLICAAIGRVGGTATFVGLAALGTLIVGLGAILLALGALMNNISGLESALDKGIEVLEKIGYALGSFFGNIIGGFSAGVMSGLPKIGECLSEFMTNAEDFIEGTKNIDSGAMKAVGDLAKAILTLTAASLIDQIVSFLGGGKMSMSEFGEEIVAFGEAIAKFSESVTGKIDPESITAAANAGLLLAEMAKAIPYTGGVAEALKGVPDWHTFNTQILLFADSIVQFSDKVKDRISATDVETAATSGKLLAEMANAIPHAGGVQEALKGVPDWHTFNTQILLFADAITQFSAKVSGKISASDVETAANAGSMLAKMADTLPTTGGIKEIFTGVTDWHTFNTQILNFGHAMVDFSAIVKDKISATDVEAAANAGSMLASMAEALPKTGGVKEVWDGITDWHTFNNQILNFGYAMVDFSKAIKGKIEASDVETAASAGGMLAELANAVPKSGGVKQFFTGDTDWHTFNEQIVAFGEAMAAFSKSVEGVSAGDALSMITIGQRLVEMCDGLFNDVHTNIFATDTVNWDGLIYNSEQLGKIVKSFGDNFPGDIDAEEVNRRVGVAKVILDALGGISTNLLDSSKGNLTALGGHIVNFGKSLSEFAADLSDVSLDGAGGVVGQFKNIMKDMMDAGLTAVDEKVKPFTTSGETLMSGFIKGCESKKESLNTMMTNFTSGAMRSINNVTEYNKWYAVGEYLVKGFSNGITDNTFKAEAAATAMAEAAIASARSVLKINSPSKVFYSIGSGVIEGFVGAVDDGERTVYKSGSGLANTVRSGFTKALSKVQDVLNNGIEARPTIRPVLDLSDVESGVGTINGMFDGSPSLGLMSNIRAISHGMNSRQNGGNDDVVSAIRDLKSTLSGLSGNHYSVNGISYNDESAVSDAIETLVQATRIDRRR